MSTPMNLLLSFPLRAISLNHADKNRIIYSGGRASVIRYKTKEAKLFAAKVQDLMRVSEKEIELFAKRFNPKEHELEINIVHVLPNMYVKAGGNKGQISSKSLDLSNTTKPLEDAVFENLRRYNPTIDDCMVAQLTCAKRYGPEYHIDFLLLAREMERV